LYNILLETEGDDLTYICSLNKNLRHLCQNKNIWIDKLSLNQLPTNLLDDKPINVTWLQQYQKIVSSNQKTKNILNHYENHNLLECDKILELNLDRIHLYHILPYSILNMILKIKKGQEENWINFENNTFTYLSYENNILHGKKTIPLTRQQIYNLLFNLFYYNLDNKLKNEKGFSYKLI
jgi:hypothetical protein